MKIAAWNVNSVRARLEHVRDWLREESPDVVCLQETKVVDDMFPREPLEDEGYNVEVFGQKAYNGVAILSKEPMEAIVRGLPGDDDEAQKRVIGCQIGDIQILNLYVPNGQEVGHDKFKFKLEWLQRLREFLDNDYSKDEKLILTGDFNITFDDRDVYDPDKQREKIHCSTPEREALANIMDFGLKDAFRELVSDGGHFTWWHYMRGAFAKNNGLRIDHFLITEPAMAECGQVTIDKDERGKKQASDHAPVIAFLGED